MNKATNLPVLSRLIQDFEGQSGMIDIKEEMMTDVLDSAFTEEGDEEASDEVVQKVLDEIGVSITDKANTKTKCPYLITQCRPPYSH